MTKQIDYKHIKNVLDIVKNAIVGHDLLRIFPEEPKSLDDFRNYCETIADIDVTFHPELTFQAPLPRGFYLAMPDGKYEICILPGQERVWERFVLCKELFHVLLDKQLSDSIFSNGENLERHLEHFLGTDVFETTPSVQSEFLAEIAAMEFLFPYEHRMKQIDHDAQDISDRYQIPKAKVEQFLHENFMAGLDPKSFP